MMMVQMGRGKFFSHSHHSGILYVHFMLSWSPGPPGRARFINFVMKHGDGSEVSTGSVKV
jgi:hypothetical protein